MISFEPLDCIAFLYRMCVVLAGTVLPLYHFDHVETVSDLVQVALILFLKGFAFLGYPLKFRLVTKPWPGSEP